jgi:hypothetical protein
MGWTVRVLGFNSQWGLGIFLFNTVSRIALGPTQPPNQWLPGALSLGVKWPDHEADHSPPSTAEVKEHRAVIPLPNTPSWHGAQIKKAQGLHYLYLFHFHGISYSLVIMTVFH